VRADLDLAAAPRPVQRLRLACIALGLTLLTFAQSSGREAADTKLDLVVAPARFLRNALSMWDPTAAAGQLQDQSYGYLFPMGPFYLLGKIAALPPWVVQRSWESMLLVAAFLGVVRLARLLGVAGFWPRVGAGLVYALAPRMLMELGVISSELLPVVALPWILIPLVRGATQGSPRRAAARSGVALLFASGINAAATLAILPVPALWLLTRQRGPRRRALIGWWAVAVVLGCLWWAVPLAVLGRYSPPFLDWIESSAVTTSSTSLIAVLRGVDHWQAYLGPGVWPGGWILVAAPAAIVATTAVAALGLAGLARRSSPHRIFLLSSLGLGLVLVTLGHVTTVGPPFAGSVRHLLDGPLNAFRNVHKFDPVLRLPIAIGVGYALAAIPARIPWHAGVRLGGRSTVVHPRPLAVLAIVAAAAVAISPAIAGRIVPQTRSVNDPSWWTQTGTWLGQHEGAASGRALVVPGVPAPFYIWGSPRDDALQPVADGPWTVRDSTPLAQPGYVRLLDAIQAMLAAGTGDPALGQVLARAGIRYLVVRNDLVQAPSDATALRFVHATIANSPGFTRVAQFGPDLSQSFDPNRLIDLGLTRAQGAVDIYENPAWRNDVAVLPAAGTIVSSGSADELPALITAGLGPDTPVIFGAAPAQVSDDAATVSALTDGIRRREFGFGGVSGYSATMTANAPFTTARAAHDYLPAAPGPLSTVTYRGIADVRASSSASAVTSAAFRSAADSPWAAVDGDPDTSWISSSLHGAVGQWFEVILPAAIEIPRVQIAFAAGQSPFPSRVRVTTDTGTMDEDVSPDVVAQTITLPPGRTESVRLTVLATSDGSRGVEVGLAAFDIAGVVPSRTLQVPVPGRPDIMTFDVASGRRSPCLVVAGSAACDRSWAARGEEDGELSRTFDLPTSAAYQATASFRLVAGSDTDALLDALNPVRAIASSVDSSDPRERAGAAVDGNVSTAWVSAQSDRLPTIALRIPARRRLVGFVLTPAPGVPATRPTQVLVQAANSTFLASVSAGGEVDFPRPATTSTLSITVLHSTLRTSTNSQTGTAHLLPVGIGEITLLGNNVPTGSGASEVTIGCDAGLHVDVDGRSVALRADADAADVLAARPIAARPCDSAALELAQGSHAVRFDADARYAPESVTLTGAAEVSTALAGGPAAGFATVRQWSATHRSVAVSTSASAFLVVRENANAGWRATLDGKPLEAVMLDGWQQGWLLPALTDGVVHLDFGPQAAVDEGLLAGLLAVLALIALAWVPGSAGRKARPPSAPLGDGQPRLRVLQVGSVVGMGLVGGLAGVVAAAVILGGLAASQRLGRYPVVPWLSGAILLTAGLAAAARPATSGHPLADTAGVQGVCLLAVAVVLLGATSDRAPRTGEPAQQRTLE
jgi:arabinofuranan 3-O-arabinosyltransferase